MSATLPCLLLIHILFPSLGALLPLGSALMQPQPGVPSTSPTCTRSEQKGVIIHFYNSHVSCSPFSLEASKISESHVLFRCAFCPNLQRGPQAQAVQPFYAHAGAAGRGGGAGSRLAMWLVTGHSNVPRGEGKAPLRRQRWTGLCWARAWARLLLQK